MVVAISNLYKRKRITAYTLLVVLTRLQALDMRYRRSFTQRRARSFPCLAIMSTVTAVCIRSTMLLGLLFFGLTLAPLAAQTRDGLQPRPLVLTHVTVIDATGAAAKPEMTVVIIGDRITALGKSGKVRAPANAQVVDATGKYLI